MRKLDLMAVVTLVVGMMLLAPSSAKSNYSNFTFEGTGYLYSLFAGSGGSMEFDLDMDTAYCQRHDVFNISGDYYVGMQRADYYTVDRIVMFYDGGIDFIQYYSDGQSQEGYFGSSLTTDEFGLFCGSGFSSAILAEGPFSISHYVGRFNPHLTYTGLNISSPEGLVSSQMSAQLYGDWYYSPSYPIFDYWNDAWVGDSGNVSVYSQLSGSDGLDVDISLDLTTSTIKIESYTVL